MDLARLHRHLRPRELPLPLLAQQARRRLRLGRTETVSREKSERSACLVDAFRINAVLPALPEVDQEHHVVTEASDTVEGRHLDDERKQIIDERVERFVDERAPRQMSHRLEFIVDEQLRRHHDEAKRVDRASERRKNPRVPAPVCFVNERVDRVADAQREQQTTEILERKTIVLCCLADVRLTLFEDERERNEFEHATRAIVFDNHRFVDLPHFNEQTDP